MRGLYVKWYNAKKKKKIWLVSRDSKKTFQLRTRFALTGKLSTPWVTLWYMAIDQIKKDIYGNPKLLTLCLVKNPYTAE